MEEPASTPLAGQPQGQPAPVGGHAARWRRLLSWLVGLYSVAMVVLWAWMYWDGDRGWLATVFLFGPRWLCALPLPLLVLAAAVYRRRLLVPLAGAALVVFFPILGLRIHGPALGQTNPTLRVLTCNVDERNFRIESLAELIVAEQPDVVALQEVRQNTPFVWPPGWYVLEQDQYILASRWPIVDLGHGRRLKPRDIGVIRYGVTLPDREIQVFNLHLSTPRPGLEAVLSRQTVLDPAGAPQMEESLRLRETESEHLSRWIEQFGGAKIVLGDFNTPTESTIFRRCWSPFSDAFSVAGRGFGFTKITGEGLSSYGARIDHVLFTPEWRCLRCWVGPDIGSDHLPLFAEFQWRGDGS